MEEIQVQELLKNYVTKQELEEIFSRQRTASEQFLEDHDRNFRLLESQVSGAVQNLNAGLSKLNIMSDALSNIMRVMQDNYEAIRIKQRDLEERVNRVEQTQGVQGEELKNFYGGIYGDINHPDQESIVAMMRKRYDKADVQHEEMMQNVNSRFDHIEDRQEIIEKQIEQWRRIYTTVWQGVGDSIRSSLPKILRWAFLSAATFILARVVNAPLMNQIGVYIKALLGIP